MQRIDGGGEGKRWGAPERGDFSAVGEPVSVGSGMGALWTGNALPCLEGAACQWSAYI